MRYFTYVLNDEYFTLSEEDIRLGYYLPWLETKSDQEKYHFEDYLDVWIIKHKAILSE